MELGRLAEFWDKEQRNNKFKGLRGWKTVELGTLAEFGVKE